MGAVLGEAISGFSYTYDFGDNWCHTVTVENRLLPDDSFNTWPVCIAGQNACPPEDVGGPPGYENYLAAIKDPHHPDHEHLLEWGPEAFDPNVFDRKAIEHALDRLAQKWEPKPRRK